LLEFGLLCEGLMKNRRFLFANTGETRHSLRIRPNHLKGGTSELLYDSLSGLFPDSRNEATGEITLDAVCGGWGRFGDCVKSKLSSEFGVCDERSGHDDVGPHLGMGAGANGCDAIHGFINDDLKHGVAVCRVTKRYAVYSSSNDLVL
jgi:hypothetical protein